MTENIANQAEEVSSETTPVSVVFTDNLDFDTSLGLFIKSNADAQFYARFCAEEALRMFQKDGQVGKLQQLHDALQGSWNKSHVSAFKIWAGTFSPLQMKQNKFSKDKRINAEGESLANDFNVDAACLKPFWEYKPEKQAKLLTRSEAIKLIQKLAANMLNEDNYDIHDPDCLALVKGFETYGQRIDVAAPVAVAA